MEQRKITVFTSKEQKKTVIMTSATTLAELKSDLRSNGINYANMDFFEGVSKTKLMADDSQLPQNVPFKGATTNELVVMLSDTNKKIKSGADMSRSDAFAEIKNKGLQDAVKAHFGGRNYTQVSTLDLISFLGESGASTSTTAPEVDYPEVTTRAEAFAAIKERGLSDAVKAKFKGRNYTQVATDDLLLFVNGNNGVGKVVEAVKIAKSAPAKASKPEVKKVETPYSDGEINKMFDGWVK
jgi:hypothetical protein